MLGQLREEALDVLGCNLGADPGLVAQAGHQLVTARALHQGRPQEGSAGVDREIDGPAQVERDDLPLDLVAIPARQREPAKRSVIAADSAWKLGLDAVVQKLVGRSGTLLGEVSQRAENRDGGRDVAAIRTGTLVSPSFGNSSWLPLLPIAPSLISLYTPRLCSSHACAKLSVVGC